MKKSKLLSLVMLRWPGMVLALTLLCALPLAGTAAQSLIDLDTRADGSRVLNMVIHDKARAVSAFKFIDIEGNYLSLENFRGKTVALHFWATWCIPCRDELPTVDALQNQLGGKNFTFVPLSVDRDGTDLVRRLARYASRPRSLPMPLAFQPPNGLMPGQAPVVAPAWRLA